MSYTQYQREIENYYYIESITAFSVQALQAHIHKESNKKVGSYSFERGVVHFRTTSVSEDIYNMKLTVELDVDQTVTKELIYNKRKGQVERLAE